jgi:hypothetical protein
LIVSNTIANYNNPKEQTCTSRNRYINLHLMNQLRYPIARSTHKKTPKELGQNFTFKASRRMRSSPRGLKHARTEPTAPLLLLLSRPTTAQGELLLEAGPGILCRKYQNQISTALLNSVLSNRGASALGVGIYGGGSSRAGEESGSTGRAVDGHG